MELLEEFTKYNDQMILKRKRTPHHRSSQSSSSSSTTSSRISTSTEEDEDMANCLILLAQSGENRGDSDKFCSRKFTEMANISVGKVGIYVYECKTCSRTFSSFQALGGHRAGHKKPKSATDEQRKPAPLDCDEEEKKLIITRFEFIDRPPSNPIQSFKAGENKPKIHECSICGSEFSSGQALGGHMRRHRTAPPSSTTTRIDNTNDSEKPRNNSNILNLDLNLPAPPEDDHLPFPANRQRLVFPSPALVDCHY